MPPAVRKGDIILIAAALAAACIIIVFFSAGGVSAVFVSDDNAGDGAAVISVDGAVWKKAPLNADASIIYESGDRRNVITIEGGAARMEEANCPDKLCVRQGAIKDAGGIIVCLPNRISVKLEYAAPPDDGVDAISW